MNKQTAVLAVLVQKYRGGAASSGPALAFTLCIVMVSNWSKGENSFVERGGDKTDALPLRHGKR